MKEPVQLTRILLYVAMGLYIAGVLVLCVISSESLPQTQPEWFGLPADKVVHFLMFLPFVPIAYLTFGALGTDKNKRPAILFIVYFCGLFMAAMTEILQSFTKDRSAEILDFLADASSLTLGFIIILFILLLKRFKNR